MTKGEKLIEEFTCAINACLGDVADEEYDEDEDKYFVDNADLLQIAKKVAFYMDL